MPCDALRIWKDNPNQRRVSTITVVEWTLRLEPEFRTIDRAEYSCLRTSEIPSLSDIED
jgi:hypothetical protein